MEAEDSGSDNEMPEVISSSAMKNERELEIKQMFQQKRDIAEEQKRKRKLKAERLALQKKEKALRRKLKEEEEQQQISEGLLLDAEGEPKEGGSTEIDLGLPISEGAEEGNTEVPLPSKREKKPTRKFYPKYNVVVDPLTRLSDPRAAAAYNFRERRLNKVQREDLAKTLTSYEAKLKVKKAK